MMAELALLERECADIGMKLQQGELQAFASLAAELCRWNRRSNLTAITDPQGIMVKHFYDSLTLAPMLAGNETLLDVGSGAGFPALPLKIVLPALRVVTVDAVLKKIQFQRHVIRHLRLQEITPVHGRVEELAPAYAAEFNVITSRAFSSLLNFANLSLPLLAPGGRLMAMKGPEGEAEVASEEKRLAELGLAVSALNRFALPASAGTRVIVTLERTNNKA